ncbi:MAG: dihydroorotate dehydrogenase [Desulfobacterota bacterium]|nr:dihydroorotate dehydrogenase [Thermodesulfobacteriota bacterium]
MSEQILDMTVIIGKLVLRNPVIIASGVFGYGREYDGLIDVERLGAIITKGISLRPSLGNPGPRIVETPSGMLNAIGLHNIGFDAFVKEKLPLLRQLNVPVIVNFYGSSVEEYAELARKLNECDGISGLEVNISCPNIRNGGIAFGIDADMAAAVTRAVRGETALPLIVKLSPNVTSIVDIALSVVNAGADALSLINTITGMVIDIESQTPVLGNITGGLSGPAIRPIAVRMVWEVAQHVAVPIIGVGGIITADDALQFLIAGATAIQVGTGIFVNPKAPEEIITGIASFMTRHHYVHITDIIGSLRVSSKSEDSDARDK